MTTGVIYVNIKMNKTKESEKMKTRQIIKYEAKELIQKNGLWLSIGLPHIIVTSAILGVALTDSTFVFPLSLVNMILTLASSLYLYQIVTGQIDIKPTFGGQISDMISTLTDKAALTYLFMNIYLFLWALIPIAGIFISVVKTYSYNLSIYIANDNQSKQYNDNITKSRTIMDGHKMDWFIQHISFIGWSLLTFITAGLAGIFVYPYIIAADAIYANEVLQQQKQ